MNVLPISDISKKQQYILYSAIYNINYMIDVLLPLLQVTDNVHVDWISIGMCLQLQ